MLMDIREGILWGGGGVEPTRNGKLRSVTSKYAITVQKDSQL